MNTPVLTTNVSTTSPGKWVSGTFIVGQPCVKRLLVIARKP